MKQGVITAQWYRRSEQPIRVAAWYSTNGLATMFSAVLAYGLGHSTGLAPWRALFLTAGLMTVLTAPVIWLVHDSDISTARFYTPKEKEQAVERLRANQTGTGSSEF
ncbi:MAG: MFS transporter, partial [Proteobacteria bacterium]